MGVGGVLGWMSEHVAVVVVVVVCAMNLIPVAYELLVACLLRSGWRVTALPHFKAITQSMAGMEYVGERLMVLSVTGYVLISMWLQVDAFWPWLRVRSVAWGVVPSLCLHVWTLVRFARTVFAPRATTLDDVAYEIPYDVLSRVESKVGVPAHELPPKVLQEALGVLSLRYCITCEYVSRRCGGTRGGGVSSKGLTGKTARRIKPHGTHHCSSCGVCVRGMDHHCPFLARCVDTNNRHMFILFLATAVLSGGFLVAITRPSFHGCAGEESAALCRELGSRTRLLLFLGLACFAIVGGLLLYTMWLIVSGTTTLESLLPQLPPRNAALHAFYGTEPRLYPPARRAEWRKNLVAVFGPVHQWWQWCVPFGDVLNRWLSGPPDHIHFL